MTTKGKLMSHETVFQGDKRKLILRDGCNFSIGSVKNLASAKG